MDWLESLKIGISGKNYQIFEWNGHGANTVNPVFYKIFLGEFYKGADDGVGQRLKGREYMV